MEIDKEVKEKQCPVCLQILDESAFHRDKARRDGLKYCCKSCAPSYKAQERKKRSFDGYVKRCALCDRELPADFFVRTNQGTQQDGLESKCLTCRSWRDRKSPPSLSQVLEYERDLDHVVTSAIVDLESLYPNEQVDVLLKKYRSELEQRVATKLARQGLDKEWKLPCWVHKKSSLER
jgi:hypothetical protein